MTPKNWIRFNPAHSACSYANCWEKKNFNRWTCVIVICQVLHFFNRLSNVTDRVDNVKLFESFPLWFIYFLFNLIFIWSHSSKFTNVMTMEVTPRSSYLIGIIRRMQSRSEMLKQNKKKKKSQRSSQMSITKTSYACGGQSNALRIGRIINPV